MMDNIFDWYPTAPTSEPAPAPTPSSGSGSGSGSGSTYGSGSSSDSVSAATPSSVEPTTELNAEEDFDDILDALNKLSRA
jgi:hypothetical protein